MIEILKIISDLSAIGLAGLAIVALIIVVKNKGIKNIFKNNNLKQLAENELVHLSNTLTEIKNKLDKIDDKLDNQNILLQRIFDRLNRN